MICQSTQLITVTKKSPCPICKKPDWCGYSDRVAVCMRVESSQPAKNGGWVHRLNEHIRLPPVRVAPKKEKPIHDFTQLAAQQRHAISWSRVCKHAEELGVTPESLDALAIGYDLAKEAYAFPMFDADEKIIGIRLRNVTGRKWAITGSRVGLFYDRLIPPSNRTAYICEGPTDTAAMITLGFWAVGRAACLGQAEQLKALLRRLGVNKIVVVADNDDPKTGPRGEFYPGREGAEKLITDLKIQAKMILPPAKDIRAWLKNGATKNDVLYLENQQAWRFF